MNEIKNKKKKNIRLVLVQALVAVHNDQAMYNHTALDNL